MRMTCPILSCSDMIHPHRRQRMCSGLCRAVCLQSEPMQTSWLYMKVTVPQECSAFRLPASARQRWPWAVAPCPSARQASLQSHSGHTQKLANGHAAGRNLGQVTPAEIQARSRQLEAVV